MSPVFCRRVGRKAAVDRSQEEQRQAPQLADRRGHFRCFKCEDDVVTRTGGGYDQRWVVSDTEKSSGGESESSAERRGVGNETGRAGLVRDTDNQNVCMLV